MEELTISKRISIVCNIIRGMNYTCSNNRALVRNKKEKIDELSITYQVSEKTITNILQGI
jgi:hypothetical protein